MERKSVGGTPSQQRIDFSIVSANLTIEAMRDSGYKDTNHALAELIDNSIDASANLVEIIAVETPRDPNLRYDRSQISEIAVVDNGVGMDSTTLRQALKFGDGTRLDRSQRGIGRFGVGLPQSSISQCKRVDIWTWQNGADNAFHCYLDLNEIRNEGMRDVPEPSHKAVDDRWKNISENIFESTGTLVVWSDLDRVRWTGGRKTLEKTAELCGRIYRKFLADEHNPINLNLILASNQDGRLVLKDEEDEQSCYPNDPLYLMAPSSTPEPFANRPMFREFSRRSWRIPVGESGKIEGDIHVRCTMARPEAISETHPDANWPRSYPKAGGAPWGKHANRNKGVSIIRAKRELELSLAWVNNYEPEERWWSVEVEFDPILDEIFWSSQQ